MGQDGRRAEIEALYRLALGREPERGANLAGFMEGTFGSLAARFFRSAEFQSRVVKAYAQAIEPQGGEFNTPPGEDLKAWAAGAFAADDAADGIIQARSWSQLYRALFQAPGAAARMGLAANPFDDLAWANLLAQAKADEGRRIAAAADRIEPRMVRGWAVDLNAPDRVLSLELWIDGRFASAGRTGQFRRDIEDRFSGSGRAGFALPIPPASVSSRAAFEVRETGHTAPIATGLLTAPNREEFAVYGAVRRELAAIRSTLARLEAQLPALESALTFRLEEWAGYFDAVYGPDHARLSEAAPGAASNIRVRIDAAGCAPGWVEDAIESALRQRCPPAQIMVVGLDDDGRVRVADLVRRRADRTGLIAPVVLDDDIDGSDPILSFPAGGVLSPDAIETLQAVLAARPDLALVYVDEDRLAPDAEDAQDYALRDHADPRLKPAFDLDLARRAPWVGDCVLLAGPGLEMRGVEGAQAALRLAAAGHAVAGAQRVLFSLRTEAETAPDAESWATVVRAHLKSAGERAEVAVLNDPLGAPTPGAVCLKHPLPKGTTATVIIPTRDRFDLLKPCLDSLEAHRGDNLCAMRVVVVDHDSSDEEVRALLAERQAAGAIEVVRHGGPFNWALMNNLAAADSDDAVLVFLNDDTVVVSPDWLDALVRQALRPEVGAAGARLLYPDGTIQHAGFIARRRERGFLIHDGVGVPGSDGGYMGRHALAHRTVAVTGACMAVSNAVFWQLGGFDAMRLPVEGNDVDFCLRAVSQGLAVIYEPAATLYHLESKSRGLSVTGERLRMSIEATQRVWSRWGEAFGDDPFFNAHFARDGRPFEMLRPLPAGA